VCLNQYAIEEEEAGLAGTGMEVMNLGWNGDKRHSRESRGFENAAELNALSQ